MEIHVAVFFFFFRHFVMSNYLESLYVYHSPVQGLRQYAV